MKPKRFGHFVTNARWTLADRIGLHGEPMISDAPYLKGALGRWREELGQSSVYLEYGSGGSTIEAVQAADHVVTVESDRRYLSAVEGRVAALGTHHAAFHPIHGNIGLTTAWGYPLFNRRTQARLDRWRRYLSAPWDLLDRLELVPDFILVDGRFRPACVLQSFLRLPAGSECRFMVDDFKRRSGRYDAFLEFATDVEFAEEAIFFRRLPEFDRQQCARLLTRWLRDPK